MIVVRPVKNSDFKDLYRLSGLARSGLTTLPHDKTILRKRIREAVSTFHSFPRHRKVQYYLFVMEDVKKKKVVGTCAIDAKVGGDEPFYTYDVKTVHRVSRKLKIRNSTQYLKLRIIKNGPTEIGTLFLDPKYRKHGNGRLLSLSRFLFMAQYKRMFKRNVIAEMRGVIDDRDGSPFWRAVGRHFFKMQFKKADLMSMRDKSFIEELVPRRPIYIPLLPISAQSVIGQVHENTIPAIRMLERQGFGFASQVDIFEAGPVMTAKLSNIKSVRESKVAKVADVVDDFKTGAYLIANVGSFANFKVTSGSLRRRGKDVILPKSVATALKVKKGDRVRILLLKRTRR